MKTEAEMGVMWPKAKERLKLPEAGRGKEQNPYRFWSKCGPADTLILDFWPPEL